MLKLKGCPKCGGDLHSGEDRYGKFLNCMQCGYLKDLLAEELADRLEMPAQTPVKAPVKKSGKKPMVAAGERKAA